ncbi:DUF6199 family natural product biosynthesis protein [Streptomyces sp. NPDC015242]|uniref:DUF6199 family natural product biosynthesis protein n=1 Tax=Streptomyces sp. NPDC015242 TaxID=3364951 RepID=UPI0036FD1A6A
MRIVVGIVILCVLAVVGLVQVIRPDVLWRINRPLQKPFVKDYDATEPSAKGYALMRVTGVIFLAVVAWMIVRQAS